MMKKMWIKKDNIYYKPFYKQKFKVILLTLFIMGFIFLAHQFFYMSQLTNPNNIITKFFTTTENGNRDKENIKKTVDIRGVNVYDPEFYLPNSLNIFKCIKTGKQIKYEWLNDDYCDCIEDGSDEPSTNACENGKFYCKFQPRNSKNSHTIPSSRVNDGICDCCDGSDEWMNLDLISLNCKNICK